MRIARGRHTAQLDPEKHADLVQFQIGMRVNRLREVKAWMPVAAAMPKMMKELTQHPELGMLWSGSYIFGRTTLSIQYWRDFESLDRYARQADGLHLPAWRAFNKAARSTDAVGVFHETFRIGAAPSEAIYANMPVYGLAAATTHVPVGVRGDRAKHRIDPATPDSVLVQE